MTAPNTPNPIPASPSAAGEPIGYALVKDGKVDLYSTWRQADFYADHRGGEVRPVYFASPASGGDGRLREALVAKHTAWMRDMTEEDWILLRHHMPDEMRERLRAALAAPMPSQEDRMRKALEEIENPIATMQKRADAAGTRLDGMIANQIANDPNYLKGIARAALAARSPASPEPVENWRDDPSADERWNAGLDYGQQQQLCNVLGVNPRDVSWDAATETLDGDVQSVIWKILCARFGDDWSALATPMPSQEDRLREALRFYADPANWIDTPPWEGDPEMVTPKAIPVLDDGEGSRPCDCGDTARAALSTTTKEGGSDA